MPSAASPAATPPSRLGQAAYHAGRALGWVDIQTARVRPWMVLGPLSAGVWLVAVWVGSSAVHTGWLYYESPDGVSTWTTAWLLAHGLIPATGIGYAYPLLLAPLAAIAGASQPAGLPYAIALNVAVGGTLALLCVYGLAKALAGRRYAYLVSAAWVVAPAIVIPYILLDYHRRYVGLQLPANVGLTTLGTYPSVVVLLVAAYFAFRALTSRSDLDGLTAGLAAGLAIAVKPGNTAFLVAPLLAFLVARRPRALAAFAVGLVPALLCLALWKLRQTGDLPLFSHFSSYFHFSWAHFLRNIDGFREFTWSRRLIEWSVIAGLIGLARRSIPGAVLIGGWLASYLVWKGGSGADFYGGTFFRSMAPAFPAAFLCVMSLPFLIPVAGRRLAAFGDLATWPQTERSRRWVVGIAAFLAIAPVVPILAFGTSKGAGAKALTLNGSLVPVDRFVVHADEHDGKVLLSWSDRSPRGARVVYAVYRTGSGSFLCLNGPCEARQAVPMTTHVPRFTDTPPPGHWTYYVAVVAGAPPPASNAIELSRPEAVDVP